MHRTVTLPISLGESTLKANEHATKGNTTTYHTFQRYIDTTLFQANIREFGSEEVTESETPSEYRSLAVSQQPLHKGVGAYQSHVEQVAAHIPLTPST